MIVAALPSDYAAAVDPLSNSPVCSVFDPGPCTPSYCGVFDGSPCVPYIMQPFGQDLRLTIGSRAAGQARTPDRPVNTIAELFEALRGCWEPPAREEAHLGMQMSVRFSFKRTGDMLGTPRVTYTSADADADSRRIYRHAVTTALERCSPMPLTEGMAGALAGRPIAIRFVDDRPE
jgi:hypothetical protein